MSIEIEEDYTCSGLNMSRSSTAYSDEILHGSISGDFEFLQINCMYAVWDYFKHLPPALKRVYEFEWG